MALQSHILGTNQLSSKECNWNGMYWFVSQSFCLRKMGKITDHTHRLRLVLVQDLMGELVPCRHYLWNKVFCGLLRTDNDSGFLPGSGRTPSTHTPLLSPLSAGFSITVTSTINKSPHQSLGQRRHVRHSAVEGGGAADGAVSAAGQPSHWARFNY